MNWTTTSTTTDGAAFVGASALKLHKVLSANMVSADVATVFNDVLAMINQQLCNVATNRDLRDKALGVGGFGGQSRVDFSGPALKATLMPLDFLRCFVHAVGLCDAGIAADVVYLEATLGTLPNVDIARLRRGLLDLGLTLPPLIR